MCMCVWVCVCVHFNLCAFSTRFSLLSLSLCPLATSPSIYPQIQLVCIMREFITAGKTFQACIGRIFYTHGMVCYIILKCLLITLEPQLYFRNILKVTESFKSTLLSFIFHHIVRLSRSSLRVTLNLSSIFILHTRQLVEERIIYIFIYTPQRNLLRLQSTTVLLQDSIG